MQEESSAMILFDLFTLLDVHFDYTLWKVKIQLGVRGYYPTGTGNFIDFLK